MSNKPRTIVDPSLATFFFRYYLGALLAFVLLITFTNILIDQQYPQVNPEADRGVMVGTVRLIEQQLNRQPASQATQVLAKLSPLFSYKLNLIDINLLQLSQRQAISQGHMVFDSPSCKYYDRVGQSHWVLALGPLNFGQTSGHCYGSAGLSAKILWLPLIGLCFGLLVFMAIRPLWNDLVAMRTMAKHLANGELGELGKRAPAAKSWLLQPLSEGLNCMAERLQAQMKAHQSLSHAVAHELRTPIARLRFGLAMLDEAESPAEIQKYRQGIERDLQELEDMVNASMSYGQLNQGKLKLKREVVRLYPWFNDLLGLIQPLVPSPISMSLICSTGTASLDRKLMYIAIRNLLVNALRFARHQIRLQVRNDAFWLEIIVDDDGPGVALAERENIFEPFHRLNNEDSKTVAHYGLGLSFVKLIAEHHAGQVYVTESPLGGARFVIKISIFPTGHGSSAAEPKDEHVKTSNRTSTEFPDELAKPAL